MTLAEFQKAIKAIKSERFREKSDNTLVYGYQRARFQKNQLERLIALAEQCQLRSATLKLGQWKRQLARAEATSERFKRLQREKQ